MSGLQKNVASQKIRVFALDTVNNTGRTGDAANITCKVSIDWGVSAALGDTNPAEVEDGYYLFDLTQAESNGNVLDFYPESSTADTLVIGVPGTVYTVAPNFPALGVAADGDLSGNVDGNVVGSVASVTGNIGGNVAGSVASVIADVGVNEWNGVSLGATNPLPNSAADAPGGLPISDAGGLDMDALNTALATLKSDWDDGGRLDLIQDAIKLVTDALTAAAAAKLALSASTMVTGTATAGTLSVTQMSTDLTETTVDHYVGRRVIWLSGAVALQDQGASITGYSATGVITYSQITEAPTANDPFIIV